MLQIGITCSLQIHFIGLDTLMFRFEVSMRPWRVPHRGSASCPWGQVDLPGDQSNRAGAGQPSKAMSTRALSLGISLPAFNVTRGTNPSTPHPELVG